MRTLGCVLSLSLVLVAGIASAQKGRQTDAQQDGFAGAVKSVSTVVTRSPMKWQQPDGPTVVLPVWCQDCAYDADGSKTIAGQTVNGSFSGELISLLRDGNGHVTDRTVTDSSTGKVIRHDAVGPFGRTEETDYDLNTGKVTMQQTFGYDQYGHMRDRISFDGEGKTESHTVITALKDGTRTEEAVWRKNGELDWQQTYDPERELERFTTFDESGSVKLTWTRSHGKVISFWEQPGQPRNQSQFGENFNDFLDNGNAENYSCHENGQCDVSHVHYEYLDPAGKRNPTSAEWRDAEGNLVVAAYCEYELDSAGNWTHRKVWVWPSEQGERALYEEDARIIAYWER